MTTVDTTGLAGKLEQRREVGSSATGKTVNDLIDEQRDQIARALPNTMSADRFARLVLTECRRTPKLLVCTPVSLLGAAMYAAQLGVEPGPLGHCYLVPRKIKGVHEVQFMLGYRGMIALARRSADITSIVAREARENDPEFSVEYGTAERIIHKPALAERGKAIAYYGVAHFRDGGHLVLSLNVEEIEARRARSSAKDRGPWDTDYDAMARKTVIRAMEPWLPLTADAATAMLTDENVRVWEPGDETPKVIEVPEEPAAPQPDAEGGDADTAVASSEQAGPPLDEEPLAPSSGGPVAPKVTPTRDELVARCEKAGMLVRDDDTDDDLTGKLDEHENRQRDEDGA